MKQNRVARSDSLLLYGVPVAQVTRSAECPSKTPPRPQSDAGFFRKCASSKITERKEKEEAEEEEERATEVLACEDLDDDMAEDEQEAESEASYA